MTSTIIENALIIAAEGFWISSNSSQLRRLLKTRNTKGLSAPSQTLNAAGNIAWITYFASKHLYVPVATNATMLLITVATLAYTLGNRKQFLQGLLAIVTIGPLTSYILVLYPAASGWVGVIYNNIAGFPQLVRVVAGHKVSGISERGVYYSVGALSCTFAYAIMIQSAPLVTGCLIGYIRIASILVYYYRYRRSD